MAAPPPPAAAASFVLQLSTHNNAASAFLRALHFLSVSKDPWAILTVTSEFVVVHAASEDQSVTATTAFPKDMFESYRLSALPSTSSSSSFSYRTFSGTDAYAAEGGDGATGTLSVQVCLSLLTLRQAVAACGAILPSKITLSYPQGDGRLGVEAVDAAAAAAAAVSGPAVTASSAYSATGGGGTAGTGRVVQCQVLTRPVREQMLDLRFHDALVPNTISLSTELSREIAGNLTALSNVEHISLSFSTTAGLTFTAAGSPMGTAMIQAPMPPRGTSMGVGRAYGGSGGGAGAAAGVGVFKYEAANDTLQPSYLAHHFVYALSGSLDGTAGGVGMGGSSSGGSSGRGGGGGGYDAAGGSSGGYAAAGSATMGAVGTGIPTYDTVTLQVNSEKQLCVRHHCTGISTSSCWCVPAEVMIIVLPLVPVTDLA